MEGNFSSRSTCSLVKFAIGVLSTNLLVSAEPLSPHTVENLAAMGVCFPTSENTEARVRCVMSCVTWRREEISECYESIE